MDITLPGGLWSLSPLGALVGGLVWFYLRMASGGLLSRKQHEEILRAAEKRGDEWKETALDYRASLTEFRDRSVVLPSKQAADELRKAAG